ncbi:MAG: hypothetical protein NC120_09905 [Ruminococcus sp.]|nr:hypothetical protein [Ruminococcus sp.]
MRFNMLKIGLRQINLKDKLLFVLQIVIVLLLFNSIIASYNGRYVLYKPYEKMLSANGYYFSMLNGAVNYEEHISLSFNELKGDYNFFTFLDVTPKISENSHIRLIVTDDTFYEHLQLPLRKGRYKNKEDVYGVISCNTAYHTGDKLNLYDCNGVISICGELTNPTYRPNLNHWENEADINIFYKKYSIEQMIEPFIIMPMSAFRKLENNINETAAMECGGIIYYTANYSKDEHEYNKEVLSSEIIIEELSDIQARSIEYLNKDLKKFMPIAIIALIVALIGVIYNTAIYTLKQMKIYSIYYLCGMTWKQALKFSFNNNVILIGIAVMLILIIILVLHFAGMFSVLGFVIELNNVLISIILISITMLLSIIIPITIIKSNSPVDLLRRNKE